MKKRKNAPGGLFENQPVDFGDRRRKIAMIVVLVVVAFVIAVVSIYLVKQKNEKSEYLNNLVEQGYLWESDDTEKYIVVRTAFPETVTETPTITVSSLKKENKVLEGAVSVSGNVVEYTALISEGNWRVTSSCDGCVTVNNNVRVGEDDEVVYIGQTLYLQEDNQVEDVEDVEDVLNGIVDGIQKFLEE